MALRLFLPTPVETLPSQLTAELHAHGFLAVPHFRGDDTGWTRGELHFEEEVVSLERFLTEIDDLRDELNAFAAEVETLAEQGQEILPLQQPIVTAAQVIVVEGSRERVALVACHLAPKGTIAREEQGDEVTYRLIEK